MRLIYTWPIIDDSLSRRDLRREGLDEYVSFAHAAGFRVIGRPAVLFSQTAEGPRLRISAEVARGRDRKVA